MSRDLLRLNWINALIKVQSVDDPSYSQYVDRSIWQCRAKTMRPHNERHMPIFRRYEMVQTQNRWNRYFLRWTHWDIYIAPALPNSTHNAPSRNNAHCTGLELRKGPNSVFSAPAVSASLPIGILKRAEAIYTEQHKRPLELFQISKCRRSKIHAYKICLVLVTSLICVSTVCIDMLQ